MEIVREIGTIVQVKLELLTSGVQDRVGPGRDLIPARLGMSQIVRLGHDRDSDDDVESDD